MQLLDWNKRLVEAVQSKGGVLAFAHVYDHLFKPAGMPWPPAPIVQKLYQSRQQSAFDQEAHAVFEKGLRYYCDLQSVNSEDALTWNYFGPLMAAPQPERVQFLNWLLDRLEPGAEPNQTCEIDLWRRIPHPETLVPGGPELDFVLTGDQCVIFGEAKWNATEGKGQGKHGDKSQLQLRSEFLYKYGERIYGEARRPYVLFVTLHRDDTPDFHGPMVSQLTWGDLCAYAQHPRYAEINRYCLWKQNPSAE